MLVWTLLPSYHRAIFLSTSKAEINCDKDSMDLGLKNKVAIVAAASRGIGFACARELAREGARVFLCSREAQHASEAAQKLHQETGADVAGIACDVRNEAAVESFINLEIGRAHV